MARSARKPARPSKAASKTPAPKTSARKTTRAPARATRKPAKAARKGPGRSASSAATRRRRVEAVPAAYGSLTPVLVVSPANEAIAFYKAAFGARPGLRMDGPGGLVLHAELRIGDSILMLADEMPPMGGGAEHRKSPRTAGATTGGVMLYVKNADAVFAQAVAAGGTVVMPLTDMFWGDRYGMIEDPFGHQWSIATHIKDMTPKEMREASAAAMAQMPQAPDGTAPAEG